MIDDDADDAGTGVEAGSRRDDRLVEAEVRTWTPHPVLRYVWYLLHLLHFFIYNDKRYDVVIDWEMGDGGWG